MRARPNILLLVVDSLRGDLFGHRAAERPPTPFLDHFGDEATRFTHAYASECWTLPSHLSMFTGLLPSEHGAHFGGMGYRGRAPTIAEQLAGAGYRTELVTRNFVFDGSLPGVTRGFQQHTAPLADVPAWHPVSLFLALAKPRFRRHVRATGFFHPRHAESRRFLTRFARALWPADERALERVLAALVDARRRRQPSFIFCNLYDVHAPYSPAPDSLLRPWTSWAGAAENLRFPRLMARLGADAYLRQGFSMPPAGRDLLWQRYRDAVRLMDGKLAAFFAAARAAGVLDETVVILTRDHGEAFGEHGLYLHDASVYDTHLHVPLWIRDPDLAATTVDDVVSTRALCGAMRAAAGLAERRDTILDPCYRGRHPVAHAEHFHYRHLPDARPELRHDLAATIGREWKVVTRGATTLRYDLARDPGEQQPQAAADTRGGAAGGRAG